MRTLLKIAALAVAASLTACGGTGLNTTPQIGSPGAAPPATGNVRAAQCAVPLPGDTFRCFALIRTDSVIRPESIHPGTLPPGFGPADLRQAYNLPSTTRGNTTVAIVDAYDDKHAEADMNVYRQTYGIGPCTTANGCFTKLNQKGLQGHYPTNQSWVDEISLDLDMISAVCPHCKIVLVEASNAGPGLDLAEMTAAKHANIISNSWGGAEWSSDDPAFDQPRKLIVASAGDDGFAGNLNSGPQQPASFASVVAVGGTSLRRNTRNPRGWSERVWNDLGQGATGSGCSALVAKPKWQDDRGCKNRSYNDVSAVADPYTPVAVYETVSGVGQWTQFGGTSASAPIIASIFALAGNATIVNGPAHLWQFRSKLNDVTLGTNGTCPAAYPYICKARTGFDGPTGWGSPNGIAAF